MRTVILLLFPLIIIGLGLPLALRLVPPNSLYGFRTAKAFSAEEMWYLLNARAGVALIIAGAVALAANFVIGKVGRTWPLEKVAVVCSLIDTVPVLIGLLSVILQEGRR